MKFTKEEKATAVRLLKVARLRIESGFSSYICLALEAAHKPGEYYVMRSLQKIIEDRCYPACYPSSLEGWLRAKGHASLEQMTTDAGKAKLRRTRLAWIDSLIEEFS